MASTRNFNVSKDARTGDTYGAGACDHLCVGTYGGESYQSWLQFTTDWTSMTSITSAVLWLKTSDMYHVAPNAGTLTIRRVTGSWTEGTSTHPMDAQGSGIDGANEPGTDAVGEATVSFSTAQNSWISKDITTLVRSWAPTSVAGGGNAANYGIRLSSGDGVTEFWSREYTSSSDAYIVVTYETNTAPTSPTNLSPTAGGLVALQNPALKFTPQDPQGDIHSQYRYQVDDDPAFGTPVDDYTVVGNLTNNVQVTRNVVATLARGTTYYWRVMTWDAAGLPGAWSAAQQFKIMVEPSASPSYGTVANLYYTAGSNTTPKLRHIWAQSCADGHGISNVTIKVKNFDGSVTYETINYTGGGTTTDSAYAVANATQYRVEIESVTCSGGVTKTYGAGTNYDLTRVRWGRAAYYRDLTSAPVAWGSPSYTPTTPAGTQVVVEYGANTSSAAPGTWYASLGSAPLNQFVHHRVTLLTNVAGTSPSLDALTINYSSSSLVADKWNLTSSTYVKVDQADQVYGTQSMRAEVQTTAGWHGFSQDVVLKENTSYTLSGRIKANATVNAHIKCVVGGVQYFSQVINATGDWENVFVTFSTGAGSGGTGVVPATVSGFVGGGGTTVGGRAWFDALKLEASTVITPWTPGFISDAVVLDAGGVQVDGLGGGIFRLRGSTGGSRDTVELGANGLVFGTDTELYSSGANVLTLAAGDTLQILSGDLKSDNTFDFFTNVSAAQQLKAKSILLSSSFADPTPNTAGIQFGADVNLYRSGADILKSDDLIESAVGFKGPGPVVRVYTASSTWSIPAGLSHIVVEVQGGGGGGGGADGQGTGTAAAGGGGGGGGYAKKTLAASALSGTYTVTVGGGGAGAVAGANAGTAGTASSFSGTGITTITGNGGNGGAGMTAAGTQTNVSGGTGGSHSGGDIGRTGDDGGVGVASGGDYNSQGFGGGSALGGGTMGNGTNAGGNGVAGQAYGGGGSGGHVNEATTNFGGGAGGGGCVIVTEYYAP